MNLHPLPLYSTYIYYPSCRKVGHGNVFCNIMSNIAILVLIYNYERHKVMHTKIYTLESERLKYFQFFLQSLQNF